MMQLKSLLLTAAALVSMPPAAKAQSEFLTCVLTNMMGAIDTTGDTADMIASVNTLCCPADSSVAACTALRCIDFATSSMVEPCTCGEAMTAQQMMETDAMLAMSINQIMPTAFADSNAIFSACCPSAETSATEVNSCLTTLDVPTTVVATTGATEPATTGATESGETTDTTTTTSTEAIIAPSTAPSSGSIARVSLSVGFAYALFNYFM